MSRKEEVERQVWDWVMNQTGEYACRHVEIPVWDRVNEQVSIRGQAPVCELIINRLRSQVWDQAWDRICEQAKEETDGSRSSG
jgi:hypothetical protein